MYGASSGTCCAYIPASVICIEVRQNIHAMHQDNHHEKVVLLSVPLKNAGSEMCNGERSYGRLSHVLIPFILSR